MPRLSCAEAVLAAAPAKRGQVPTFLPFAKVDADRRPCGSGTLHQAIAGAGNPLADEVIMEHSDMVIFRNGGRVCPVTSF